MYLGKHAADLSPASERPDLPEKPAGEPPAEPCQGQNPDMTIESTKFGVTCHTATDTGRVG